MRSPNEFLDTTRPQQMSMFHALLPPMRMGAPDHVHRHSSYIFYELSRPDNDALEAQNDKDFQQ